MRGKTPLRGKDSERAERTYPYICRLGVCTLLFKPDARSVLAIRAREHRVIRGVVWIQYENVLPHAPVPPPPELMTAVRLPFVLVNRPTFAAMPPLLVVHEIEIDLRGVPLARRVALRGVIAGAAAQYVDADREVETDATLWAAEDERMRARDDVDGYASDEHAPRSRGRARGRRRL